MTWDRLIRLATAAVVCAVVGFAAVVSYSRIYGLGRIFHGQDGSAAPQHAASVLPAPPVPAVPGGVHEAVVAAYAAAASADPAGALAAHRITDVAGGTESGQDLGLLELELRSGDDSRSRRSASLVRRTGR